LDRVTSGTILVLNNTNRDEAKQRKENGVDTQP
jgi:hypothetical protein